MLDSEGMQIYAFCLWQLGENDHALSVVRNLASSVSAMEMALAAASVSFICRMLYYISGLDLAVSSILKMPKEFLQSTKVWIVASAIHALDHSNRLAQAVSSSHYSLLSHDEIIEKHYLTALAKLVNFLFSLLLLEHLMLYLNREFAYFGLCHLPVHTYVGGLCRLNMDQIIALDFRVELATLKKLFTVTPIVICLGRY
jgi:hypothetical protein